MIDDARLGGFFETSHSHLQHNYHQGHQEENLINNAGGLLLLLHQLSQSYVNFDQAQEY